MFYDIKAPAINTIESSSQVVASKSKLSYKCHNLFSDNEVVPTYSSSLAKVVKLRPADQEIKSFKDIIHLRNNVIMTSNSGYVSSMSKEDILLNEHNIDTTFNYHPELHERAKNGLLETLFLRFSSDSESYSTYIDTLDKLVYMNLGKSTLQKAGWTVSEEPLLSIDDVYITEAYYCKLAGESMFTGTIASTEVL